MSKRHLIAMFERADKVDMREGLLAYGRYNTVMRLLAERWEFPIDRVAAVFCALSPNNDYDNNLRSLVSVLYGMRMGWEVDEVEVSTYRHCLKRAWMYAQGTPFLDDAKGLKIRNFYLNVLYPTDNRYVTIDGHMVAIWRNKNLTMKEAICRTKTEYNDIADACKQIAFELFIHPNQFQATCWFARKRLFNIKQGNASQYDLLIPGNTDMWRTLRDIETIQPFPRRVRVSSYRYRREDEVAGKAKQSGQGWMAGFWDATRLDEDG